MTPTAQGRVQTRNPSTGMKRISVEATLNREASPVPFLMLKRSLPKAAAQIEERATQLEAEHTDAVSFEFRWSDENLVVEHISPLKREPTAAVTIAVSLVKEGLISQQDALQRVEPTAVEKLMAPVFSSAEVRRVTRSDGLLLQGRGKGLGVTTGFVAPDTASAYQLHKQGKPVILVRPRLTYQDRDVLPIISGFVVTEGSVQAALLFEKPGVIVDDLANLTDSLEISLDPESGQVFKGRLGILPGAMSHDLMTLLSWADETREMEIRVNATSAQEVEYSRAFGATGVGLCRIESLFQQPARLPLFAEVLKDICLRQEHGTGSQETLETEIQAEIEALFQAASPDRPPFILRLLDVPVCQMLRYWKDAQYMPADYYEGVLEDWLHELNPLGGLRFGRLSLLYPELLKLQIRAILMAQKNHPVRLQLMMPGVVDVQEVRILRKEVQALASGLDTPTPMLGSMLETPRACLTIGQLVKEGEFFSFGTGDLTESTCGLSRYDAPISFLPHYVEKGIFRRDPFEVLDQTGVGALMKQAVKVAKQENPTVELGTCGAQAVEELSMSFCCRLGLDYVSVPMHHIPAARLAAARAVLSEK